MGDACCKVGRVAAARNLDRRSPTESLDEYLVARWLGRDEFPETGLRPLTDWFNEQLLKDAYAANGRSTTETRIESEYEALRGDDDIARGEVVDDLRTDGIDGEALASDFVSKSSLQRHLTNCLDAKKHTESRRESNWEEDRVEFASTVASDNVEGALRSLENKGELPGATEAVVDVPVYLRCPECNTRVRFLTAKERGYVCKEHLGAASDD